MNTVESYDDRIAAYRRMKPSIDQDYPKGTFVAIADNSIIASAENFRAIVDSTRATGRDPRRVLVIQAGVDYPDYVTIFM